MRNVREHGGVEGPQRHHVLEQIGFEGPQRLHVLEQIGFEDPQQLHVLEQNGFEEPQRLYVLEHRPFGAIREKDVCGRKCFFNILRLGDAGRGVTSSGVIVLD